MDTAISTINYTYGDTEWPDKLTSYDGKEITYDTIGNRTSYDGYTYVWEAGRQLKRMTKDGSTIDYKYGDSGIRQSKTVNGVTTHFTTIGGKITSQNNGTDSLYFRYDKDDSLIGVQVNGAEYLYIKNLQGDIISIVDYDGNVVVNYTYDSFGKVVSITGTLANTIGQLNPMCYRGYYYDSETGLYYLQSRYYDAEMQRFINADDTSVISLAGEDAVGINLFAYCANNPVMKVDPSGYAVISPFIRAPNNVILAITLYRKIFQKFNNVIVMNNNTKKVNGYYMYVYCDTANIHSRGWWKCKTNYIYQYDYQIYYKTVSELRKYINKKYSFYINVFKTNIDKISDVVNDPSLKVNPLWMIGTSILSLITPSFPKEYLYITTLISNKSDNTSVAVCAGYLNPKELIYE